MEKIKSKKQKPDKLKFIINLFLIFAIILLTITCILQNSILNTMIGAEALKNINIVIILKFITGIIFAIPVFLNGIYFLIICNDAMRLFARIGIVFCTIAVTVMFFLLGARSYFDEQHYIRNEYGNNTDLSILLNNISDLKNDNYKTYTINNCYVDFTKYSYHYNYTVTFYNGKNKVAEAQIGNDDYNYLKNLPYGFDTEITVYNKSGFLRSIKPSVDFNRNTAYEHFFTISISGDKIVYEKNVDMKFNNIQWSGFKKDMHNKIENSLFGIAISEERPTLDADYIGLLCEEVCIYGTMDGKYRRLSNILDKNDLNENSGT